MGADRLWLHRRTLSCVWREQRKLDSYWTQHTVQWWRPSLSVVRQCLTVHRSLRWTRWVIVHFSSREQETKNLTLSATFFPPSLPPPPNTSPQSCLVGRISVKPPPKYLLVLLKSIFMIIFRTPTLHDFGAHRSVDGREIIHALQGSLTGLRTSNSPLLFFFLFSAFWLYFCYYYFKKERKRSDQAFFPSPVSHSDDLASSSCFDLALSPWHFHDLDLSM